MRIRQNTPQFQEVEKDRLPALLTDVCPKFLEERDISYYVELPKEPIGDGGYGSVFLGRPTIEGISKLGLPPYGDIVVKIIRRRVSSNFVRSVINETTLTRKLDLPNVPKIYGCFSNSDAVYIIMEHITGKDLMDCITELSRDEKVNILNEIANTLHTLHENGIAHRDIKLENIMYSKRHRRAYIIDFGLACRGDACSGVAGTMIYFDPYLIYKGDTEISFRDYINADWWSFMVAGYMLFSETAIYTESTEARIKDARSIRAFDFKRYYKEGHINFEFVNKHLVPSGFMKVFERCLRDPFDLSLRPTAEEILSIDYKETSVATPGDLGDLCLKIDLPINAYIQLDPTTRVAGTHSYVTKGSITSRGAEIIGISAGTPVAVKQIVQTRRIVGLKRAILNEVQILKGLDLETVPKFYKCLITPEKAVAIIMEPVDGVSISSLNLGELSYATKVRMMRDIAQTLQILHESGIVHRDVNVSNIMYSTEHDRSYLVDFGFSCTRSTCGGMAIVPLRYIDPVSTDHTKFMYRFEDYVRADWWAFLICCFILFVGVSPYGPVTERVFKETLPAEYNYKKLLDEEKVDFVFLDRDEMPEPLLKVFKRVLVDPFKLSKRPSGNDILSIFELLLDQLKEEV
jgi:serine/threonine protein kinase